MKDSLGLKRILADKVKREGLTYDDVLLVPGRSSVMPRDVSIETRLTRKIKLNIPLLSAAMDTVTEARLAIAMAREGGVGVLHKNMSVEDQSAQARRVKRSESGMILDPITLEVSCTVGDARALMARYSIGGIPVVDSAPTLGRDNHESGSEIPREQSEAGQGCNDIYTTSHGTGGYNA